MSRYNGRQIRSLTEMTWATPVQNVGTDTRQFGLFTRKAKTGALQGGFVPFLTQTLGESELAVSVLATSVLGSIAEHALKFGVGGTEAPAAAAAVPPLAFPPSKLNGRLPPELGGLQDAFRSRASCRRARQSLCRPRALTRLEYCRGLGRRAVLAQWFGSNARRLAQTVGRARTKFKVGQAYVPRTWGLRSTRYSSTMSWKPPAVRTRTPAIVGAGMSLARALAGRRKRRCSNTSRPCEGAEPPGATGPRDTGSQPSRITQTRGVAFDANAAERRRLRIGVVLAAPYRLPPAWLSVLRSCSTSSGRRYSRPDGSPASRS